MDKDQNGEGNQDAGSIHGPLPRSVWVLSFVSFFADISSEMMVPLLPLFLVGALGSSEIQLGIMEGAAVLIVSLMSAYAGFRSDRRGAQGGRVRWLNWGYGLPVLGKSIITLATAPAGILFGRLLDRFGKGLRGAPRDALIVDAVPATRLGEAFGLHRALDTAGALIGTTLAAFLLWWLVGTPDTQGIQGSHIDAPAWVFRQIFAVSAVLGLASWGLTFLVSDPRDVDVRNESNRNREDLQGTSILKSLAQWRHLPSSYWWVVGMLVLFSLANSSDGFLLLRVRELGFSPWAVVLGYSLFNITYALVSYPVGVLSDRVGRWRVIGLGWGIYLLVYLAFAWLPRELSWGVWPLMAVYGLYMALTEGVGKALIAQYAPSAYRGTAMGVFHGITGVTTFIASLLAGWLWHAYGSGVALSAGAVFSGLALVVLGGFALGYRPRA
ncbi:MAG: MFS transporter [Pirellula sp.]